MADRPGARPAPPAADAEPGVGRTLLVALAVCGVCSAVVTSAVVTLRPLQLANQQRESEARIQALLGRLPGVAGLVESAGAALLEVHVVDLASGAYAPSVDLHALLEQPEEERPGEALPADRDPAGVGRVPRHAPVYELRREGAVDTVILPVRGQGYLSTLRGFLAVAGDGNTVRGITFTEHEETPGLGAEIDDSRWQARWQGKKLRDDSGEVRIRVVEEAPAPGSPEEAFRVQGISGATMTSDGVSELVRFWIGPDGFGPYLRRLREESKP